MTSIEIRRVGAGDDALVMAAGHLFDKAADPAAIERFLAAADHHLFLALAGGKPVGFVSGVELTHPDKGTEMFLYELAVDERHRRMGIASELIAALRDLARKRGCYDMWVLTDHDNKAALGTYRKSGTDEESSHVMLTW
ncbi:MAG TPA: GNAT family N-acetyltransferase, partial [Candidatus Dormibacteraeota bacterium]|nr:GNAT family N-acetyltransferase [Candidatus Dormibacteraeota bacterium]